MTPEISAISETTRVRHDTATAQQVALPQARQAAPPPKLVEETLAAVAKQIDSYLRSNGRSLEFSIDSSTGRTVIAVRDASNGTLIRQIPSEEAMRIARAVDSQGPALVDLEA